MTAGGSQPRRCHVLDGSSASLPRNSLAQSESLEQRIGIFLVESSHDLGQQCRLVLVVVGQPHSAQARAFHEIASAVIARVDAVAGLKLPTIG